MKNIAQLMLFLCPLAGAALPCFVDSTNDGGGRFSYTFRRGDDSYVWGNCLIQLTFPGGVDVQSPPGWSHSVEHGLVVWIFTNGLTFLDEPVTFHVRSCLTQVTRYSGTYDAGPYQGQGYGAIYGNIYSLPEYQLVAGGYQWFDFIGPALPDLILQQYGTNLTVSWTNESQQFQLEVSDRLEALASWAAVTNEPTVNGFAATVELPASGRHRFFRLAARCSR